LSETLAGDPDERRLRALLSIGPTNIDSGADFLASLGADEYVERLRQTLRTAPETLLLQAAADSDNPLHRVLAGMLDWIDGTEQHRRLTPTEARQRQQQRRQGIDPGPA